MRDRLNLSLPVEMIAEINDLATRSAIVEATVISFLSPDGADRWKPPSLAVSIGPPGPASRKQQRPIDRGAGVVRPLLANHHVTVVARRAGERPGQGAEGSSKRWVGG